MGQAQFAVSRYFDTVVLLQDALVAKLAPGAAANPLNEGLMKAINQVDGFLHAHKEKPEELEQLKQSIKRLIITAVVSRAWPFTGITMHSLPSHTCCAFACHQRTGGAAERAPAHALYHQTSSMRSILFPCANSRTPANGSSWHLRVS